MGGPRGRTAVCQPRREPSARCLWTSPLVLCHGNPCGLTCIRTQRRKKSSVSPRSFHHVTQGQHQRRPSTERASLSRAHSSGWLPQIAQSWCDRWSSLSPHPCPGNQGLSSTPYSLPEIRDVGGTPMLGTVVPFTLRKPQLRAR